MDAPETAPDDLKDLLKRYQKVDTAALSDENVFDSERQHLAGFCESKAARTFACLPEELVRVISDFTGVELATVESLPVVTAYEHPHLPGLYIYPGLLPTHAQTHLLDLLLHRDLSNPEHKTNLHLHYALPAPSSPSNQPLSLFSSSHSQLPLSPLDPTQHRSLPLHSALSTKLHWATLGGQYDWTLKTYPAGPPPRFPPDIGALVTGLFPAVRAQAAIVNVYGARDTLGLHRDVAEACARPLVSVSLGCEGVFVAGLPGDGGEGSRKAVMRLRSGDVLVMSGWARWAWHAVPRVLGGTCPEEVAEWPCEVGKDGGEFEHWRGWMRGKRVNLNVRQMFDES